MHSGFSRLVSIWLCGFVSTIAIGEEKVVKKGDNETTKLLKIFTSEFIEITPGKGKFPASFQMGSTTGTAAEKPVHKVTFQHSFAMAKYEVPQNLYTAVMGKNPSRWKGPRNSVEEMTWAEAYEFCTKITKLLQKEKLLTAEEEIRLPTEAEWEYCCRAGTTTAYSFGEKATAEGDVGKKASLLDPYAWHTGNAAGNDPPVGALKPNPWGLYDMHGYLWEFTADVAHENYNDAPTDGTAWSKGGEQNAHMARSGSWKEQYGALRSSSRLAIGKEAKGDDIGFRCVKCRKQQSGS